MCGLSADFYRDLIEKSTDLIQITDADGSFIYTNSAWRKESEYSDADLNGLSFWDLIRPGDLSSWQTIFQKINSEESSESMESVLITRTGKEICVEGQVSCRFDGSKNIKLITFIFRNITAKKAAEKALRENEETYRILIQNSHDIIYSLSLEGVMTFVSSAWTLFIGHPPEEVIGKHFGVFMHPDDVKTGLDFLHKVFETGQRQEGAEYRVKTINGTWRWHSSSVVPLFDKTGKIISYVGIARDITELKKAGQELLEKSEEFERFFSINLDLLCIADTNGHFLKVNKSWEDLLGYPREFLENKKFLDFVHPDDIQKTLDVMSSLTSQEQVFGFTNRYRTIDGSYKIIEWRSRPFENKIYAAARDITERVMLENELKEKKEQFELAIKGSNDGIWDWNFITNELYLSPRWKEQLGYRDDELPNQYSTVERLVYPDDLKMVNEKARRYLNNELPLYDIEMRMRHKDGSLRWIWARGEALRDKNGKAIRMAGSHTDVTERINIEKQLSHSHDLMRYIIEHNRSAVAVHNKDMRFMYVSQNYLDLFGLAGQDIIGKYVKEVFPDLPKKLRDVHQRSLKGEVITAENDPYLREDGIMCWTRWESRPWYENDGSIGGIVVYFEVLNEFKHMEQVIFKEREQFKTTLLSVGDGVISTDDQGNITVMNPVAEKLIGWTLEEAYGKPLDEVFVIANEYTGKASEDPAKLVLKTGSVIELGNHTVLKSRTGAEIPIEDSAAPIKDRDGKTNGVVIVFRDFTEKREKQKQVEFLSIHDHLTGLYNRRYIEDTVKRLDTVRNLPFAVMVLDVNGLKLTNDAFGHGMGDLLLKTVAEIMKQVCRDDDIIGRMGGDEFYILLPQTDALQAENIQERILSAIAGTKLESVVVSLAVGYAVKTDSSQDINAIMTAADNQMYQHKIKYGRTMRSQTIETVMRNINFRFYEEQTHTERVSQYCELITKAMNMSEGDIQDIKTAGILHDIGKIMIPPELFYKQGKLTDQEMQVIRRHPETGYQILKAVDEYAKLAPAVLSHHEHWDGNGYPQGLRGEAIPLFARIISLADAYEAMISQRPYRRKKTKKEALDELERCAGTQFDPEIVRIFVDKVL